MRGPVKTPALQSRVTCHNLKRKHVFWYPLASQLLRNISKHSFTNISEQKYTETSSSVLFLGWYTHRWIAGNSLASEDCNLLHTYAMAYKK